MGHEKLAGRLKHLMWKWAITGGWMSQIANRPAFKPANGPFKPLMKLSSRTILHPIFPFNLCAPPAGL